MDGITCQYCGELLEDEEALERHVDERHPEATADERDVARALGLDEAAIEEAGIDEGTGQTVDGTGTGTDSEVEE